MEQTIADKLLLIAENEPKIYQAGYEKGKAEGGGESYEEIYAQGKAEGMAEGQEAERNAFWETNQVGGNREHYNYAYAHFGYDDSNFNPIYPIVPTNSNGIANMFYSNQAITNTKVDIIVTNASARQAFKYCRNMRTVLYIEFNNCTDFLQIFQDCIKLSYIRVGGEIDQTIDFKHCPLDLESAKSVIEHLKNFRDIEEFAYTVTFSDSTWALLDADGSKLHILSDGSQIEGTWRDLLTYICWNS